MKTKLKILYAKMEAIKLGGDGEIITNLRFVAGLHRKCLI
jgi:hypothetical protein